MFVALPWYVRGVTDSVDHLIARYGVHTVTEVMQPMLTDERILRIEQVLDARLSGLTMVLENQHHPHNGAAAIRSVEAMGLDTLHVVESTEPFSASPAITIGCDKWIDIIHHRDMNECARTLRAQGFALVATCPEADVDIETIDASQRLALVFGNEREGLTDQALSLCDRRVKIPMFGFTRSFNLSVSVALVTYRLAARRRQALQRPGDLDEEKRDLLRARWYAMTVRGAEAILARHVSERTQSVWEA